MPRRRRPTHCCAAPDCRNQAPEHRLMCRPHWLALPASLRFAIAHHNDRANYLANLRQAERILTRDGERIA